MSLLVLRFPNVETAPNGRSRQCPYCGSAIIQSWGQIAKMVRDSAAQEITIHRYRCCKCGRTFRTYPEGVDRSLLSLRMHNLAALTFAMGLSVKDVTEVFSALGINLSRMTIYRDGHDMANRLDPDGQRKYNQVFLMEKSHTQRERLRGGVRLIIDLGQGNYVVLGILDEYNPRAVQGWLEPVCREIGAEVSIVETGKLNARVSQPAV
jgi:DNA-directed RNA polymerase subunit RPC12/RpoP